MSLHRVSRKGSQTRRMRTCLTANYELQVDTHAASGDGLIVADTEAHVRNPSRQRGQKPVSAKQYSASFLWGQLVTWYKQTIYNPATTLSAERRGTLSLPALENCYNDVSFEFLSEFHKYSRVSCGENHML